MRVVVGAICRVVGNTSGHNLAVGETVTVTNIAANGNFQVRESPNWFGKADLKVVSIPKPALENLAKQSKKETELLESRLAYVSEKVGGDGGDSVLEEEEYKKFTVKKILGQRSLTSDQKADKIVSLFD